jgi:hypothetical protein
LDAEVEGSVAGALSADVAESVKKELVEGEENVGGVMT